MTFYEAIKYAKDNSFVEEMLSDVVDLDDVIDIIEKIKEEYAPTVEMGHQQAKIFASYYHPEKPLNKNKFDYPDSLIMKSISEKDLVQAWLHPEMIKIKE